MSSRGVPEVLMKKVDDYVDSLAPQIQPRITAELEDFQQKTIDSLETQVVEAFRSLFSKDRGASSADGSQSRSPWSLSDAIPDSYGGQSLPFADEIATLTRGFSKITEEAGDDVRDIFALTEGTRGGSTSDGTRSRGGDRADSSSSRGGAMGFLSAAINVVQDRLDNDGRGGVSGGQGLQLDGLLGVISNTVKDASRNPEEKARLISPEIKERVGEKLREQHAPLAEQFTRIAMDHIKRWLRGNTTTRDLGDGVKGEIEDQVKGLVKGIGSLFGNARGPSSEESTRSFGHGSRNRGDSGGNGDAEEESGGFSKVISDKLSTGLAKVHREVRLEFRKVLGGIEKRLFELLPDEFQRPLEKILGGNPFDAQMDRDAGSRADRGFGDDIKAKLVGKIRGLVRKVQETLREGILAVVNGGHRKFERASWVFVQNMVEQKVQKYLPKVKISVPDDIGNEGVSVGAPTSHAELGGGGGQQSGDSSHGDYAQPGYNDPPPPSQYRQDHGPDDYRQHQSQQYQSDEGHQQNEGYYQQNQGYGQNRPY
ncbi:hypothetical protein SODALDRAFT_327968 [Sodiomyces alkalinus F11]|uniref:Uncharacterized protein n=1 Tax=Sodiomyces alkalinus (strain CBS 110278 / VKM F-3762 / F11) TaxID=1314773 RepID=A0A3N2QAH0_SODAK|nr:hypothetical protein SODALDRAFT_327968 [Sodiomyces alkalinus F11]ROT43752.1 hypothetical protein SODALDRAFT_327968 [Sodiomyces alkalinus F11]